MCIGVEKEIAVVGMLNKKIQAEKDRLDKLYISTDDVFEFSKTLWDAGCGPVVLNFEKSDLVTFFDKYTSVFEKAQQDRYRIRFEQLDSEDDPSQKGKEKIMLSIFSILKAQLSYPFSLYQFMSFDYLFK